MSFNSNKVKNKKLKTALVWLLQKYYTYRSRRWFHLVWAIPLGIIISAVIVNFNSIASRIITVDSPVMGWIIALSKEALFLAAIAFNVWYVMAVILRPIGRESRWYYFLNSALITIVSAFVLCLMIVRMREGNWVRIVIPIAALLLTGFVVRRLEYGVLAMLVLISSVFHDSVVPKPLPIQGMGFGLAELLLIFMLAIVYVRNAGERRLDWFRSPMFVPMGLLFLAVVLSVIVSIDHNARQPSWYWTFKGVYNSARPVFMYLLFFVVAFGLRSEKQLRTIIIGATVISAVVALLMGLQYFLGTHVKIFFGTPYLGPRVESLSSDEIAITRSLPPGLAMISAFFPIALTLACVGKRRSMVGYGIAAAILGLGVVFSFTRTVWISNMAAVAVIVLLAGGKIRRRLLIVGAVAIPLAIVGSVSIAGFSPKGGGADFAQALSSRFFSMFERKTASSASLTHRYGENRAAWKQITEHPITGIGVGHPVNNKRWVNPINHTQGFRLNFVIHNSYLQLWVTYGILGLIAYLWLALAVIFKGIKMSRKGRTAYHRAFGVSCAATVVGFLMRGLVTMCFVAEPYNIVTMAVVFGLLEAASRVDISAKGESLEPARAVSGTSLKRRAALRSAT